MKFDLSSVSNDCFICFISNTGVLSSSKNLMVYFFSSACGNAILMLPSFSVKTNFDVLYTNFTKNGFITSVSGGVKLMVSFVFKVIESLKRRNSFSGNCAITESFLLT